MSILKILKSWCTLCIPAIVSPRYALDCGIPWIVGGQLGCRQSWPKNCQVSARYLSFRSHSKMPYTRPTSPFWILILLQLQQAKQLREHSMPSNYYAKTCKENPQSLLDHLQVFVTCGKSTAWKGVRKGTNFLPVYKNHLPSYTIHACCQRLRGKKRKKIGHMEAPFNIRLV